MRASPAHVHPEPDSFDQDPEPATRAAVDTLARRLGRALTQAGYAWRRIAWAGSAKGLDDAPVAEAEIR